MTPRLTTATVSGDGVPLGPQALHILCERFSFLLQVGSSSRRHGESTL